MPPTPNEQRQFRRARDVVPPAEAARQARRRTRGGDRAPVAAPADAKVAYAGPLTGWGQVVVILDLGPGWRAVIAGLEQLDVQADTRVSDGQTLGRSGPDGDVYFELRRDERPIDPGPWLR